jgi:adenylylsulfate kinase
MENWDKKIHVKSSLERKDGQYAIFIGRWQPLHDGHKAMFQKAMQEGKNVLICIRDVEVDEKNPFTSEQVKENIETNYASFFKQDEVKVIIIPDVCSVEFGRGVGYDIIEHLPPMKIAEISATKIREQLKKEGKL